jgi:dipeptidyl aminopeptidase/acylaminoacyl peptidase
VTPLRTSPARATGLLVGLLAAIACVSPAAGASTSSAGIAYVTGGGAGLPSVSVADSSGGNARKLGRGTGPLLSPNGLTVAASDVGSSAHALTLYPATGGTATGYFTAATAASAVAWSPDSRYLAVELTGENAPSISGYGLAIIDTETGIEHVIANGVIYGASFAPGTSDTLVYARAPSLSATAATNIFTFAATGTATTQITTDGRDADPVWGTRGIAFVHERLRKRNAPLGQIWLMQPNGTHRKQITHVQVSLLAEGLVPLAFSADGTRLAAEFEGEDTSIGYSVSILTGHSTQLKVGDAAVSAWGISSSGHSVLISVGGFEQPPSKAKIERIPFSGGHPTRLIAHGNYPSWNQ